jgi:hypothetical protein
MKTTRINIVGATQFLTRDFEILFKLKTQSTLSLFDFQDAFMLLEELVSDIIDIDQPLTEQTSTTLYDTGIIAMINEFQITPNEYKSIEYCTIVKCFKSMLELYADTINEITKPELWTQLRDTIEYHYCEIEPYTHPLDLSIAEKTLRTVVGFDLNTI